MSEMNASELLIDFLDSSALVKHYHDELGSDAVNRVLADTSALRTITDISVIEWHSAFVRRVRMREISADDFQAAKAELDADIQSGRLRVEIFGELDKPEAARLIEQYGLSQELM